ncbi:hypothetical protein [Silicimonas sp. MF1-12-2]|uniref:hypothetical protein n=1 Tax=Silicimonas sp. MF1-12-2 TaxID=3384793 RepID=UPI0039B659DF
MTVKIASRWLSKKQLRSPVDLLQRFFVIFAITLALPVAANTLEQQLKEIDEVLPGNSYTKYSPALAVQAWEMAATVAFIQKPTSCQKTKLINTKVTDVDEKVVFTSKRLLKQGRWSEIWTFDKCGTRIQVRAAFQADGKGAADGEFSLLK